jgi:16S rRNA (cytidine1402-2'-O)-methyltransferase
VLFEAPHRITDTLADLVDAFGADRPAALCRELTKTHEEVRRGTLGDLAGGAATDPPRGEITLVVGGAAPASAERPADAQLAAAVAALESTGTPKKAAIAAVASARGVPKREVYDAVLRART